MTLDYPRVLKHLLQLAKNSHLLIRDYVRIIHAFLTKANGWGNYYDIPSRECEMGNTKYKTSINEDSWVCCQCNNKTPKDIFKYILEKCINTIFS